MHFKRQKLLEILRDCESVLVGYSGGVDSVLLAKVAVDALGGERVLAVTGKSDSLAPWMEEGAREIALRFGIRWMAIHTAELADPRYVENGSDRCYFCKSELWDKLVRLASERGLRVVADGSNADDVGDHRPGGRAGDEHAVRSPLLEAGLSKSEIREWSRELGLPTWDQPAAPCLSSRIAYGIPVTSARLQQVARAESALRDLGLRDFRVRHHGTLGRLEVQAAELPGVRSRLGEVAEAIRSAGFQRVALDLDGYRRGALNEGLETRHLVQLGGAA